MEGIERVLLKMLPNQEGRNKYFIFSMQSLSLIHILYQKIEN